MTETLENTLFQSRYQTIDGTYHTTIKIDSTVSFTMNSVSELNVLLSQALGVAEIKKIGTKLRLFFSQLPLFLYLGDGKFIPQKMLSQFSENKIGKKYSFFFYTENLIIVQCLRIF